MIAALGKTKLEKEIDTFSRDQRKVLYQNTFAIELNENCSGGCFFCGFESKLGTPQNFIQSDFLEQIASEMSEDWTAKRCILLYDQTDPLDHPDYFNILKMFEDRGIGIATTTTIPAGTEEKSAENLSLINRISISHVNRERLTPHFQDLGIAVYLDLQNYLKLLGKNDPFEDAEQGIRVEKSVKETIDNLFGRYPFLPKQTRFYDLRRDGNNERSQVQERETLFLYCDDSTHPSPFSKITDRDYFGVLNVGRAFNLDLNERGSNMFGKSRGVKITPNGFFNVYPIKPTPQNRTGRIIEQITPEDFRVLEYNELHDYPSSTDRIEDHYVKAA
jgi:hypothetical protein